MNNIIAGTGSDEATSVLLVGIDSAVLEIATVVHGNDRKKRISAKYLVATLLLDFQWSSLNIYSYTTS